MIESSTKPTEYEAETSHTINARVDVFEKDDEYLVKADMPGVDPNDVDIRFDNGELTLLARRQTTQGEKIGYHRSFRLGDHVASDRIEAGLKNGVLTLKLPKVESIKPKRIAVKG